MPRSQYGVPVDLYADDPELDPLRGSPLEQDTSDEEAALDEIARPPSKLSPTAEPPAPVASRPAVGGAPPKSELGDLLQTYRAPPPAPGYGPGLDGDALAKAQDEDASRQSRSNLREGIYSTFADTPRPKMAQRNGAAELLQQRQGVDQEDALVRKREADQRLAENRDPASERSRQTRDFFRGVDPETVKAIGPGFDRMSHDSIMEQFPYLRSVMLAKARQAAAKGKANLDADQQATYRAILARVQDEKDDLSTPLEYGTLPTTAIKELTDFQLKFNHEHGLNRRGQNTAAQGEQRLQNQGRQLDQGDRRLGLRAQGQAFHVSQSDVPDVEDVDPAHPHALTSGQAVEFQHQRAAVDSAQSAIDFTKAQLKKYGRRLGNPLDMEAQTALGVIRSRMTEALPQLSAANGFGNPTVSHIELSHASTGGDAAEFQNLVNQGRLPAILDSVMESAHSRYGASLTAAGKRRAAPGSVPRKSHFAPDMPNDPVDNLDGRPNGTGPGSDDTVMVIPPGGGKAVPVHRDKLEEAIQRGGKVVNG